MFFQTFRDCHPSKKANNNKVRLVAVYYQKTIINTFSISINTFQHCILRNKLHSWVWMNLFRTISIQICLIEHIENIEQHRAICSHGSKSNYLVIIDGEPQGSMLGPLSFRNYIIM